jgi:hypothetical protein
VLACKRQLSARCRLLIEAAADESKPAEIALMLGLSRKDGKKISDSLRGCRRTLRLLLRKMGYEPELAGTFGEER